MSAVLIDTHIALWALGDPARLTVEERSLMVDPAIDRCLSPISVWEAAIKRQAGRLHAPRHLSAVLAAEFRMLDLSAILLEAAAELPRHHGDPFDRVLVAHALQDDLSLLTRDAAFAEYGVRLAP
ncbi:MAG: type II toxin-antitoxin system VapC family toxin [Candidatus Rokuibacteriota bacterium]